MKGALERLRAGWELQRAVLATPAGRWIAGLLAVLGVGTVVALVALWPHGTSRQAGTIVVSSRVIEPATVVSVAQADCPAEARPGCQRVGIHLDAGPRRGRTSVLFLPGDEATPRLSPGDKIRVASSSPSVGGVSGELLSPTDPSQAPYTYVDFQRGTVLLWLTFAFAALVFLLGGRVGAVSLVGAALGLLLVTSFVAPAIVQGSPPFAVALVGAFAAMFLAIVPIYGLAAKSLAALLGTAISLLAIAGLALFVVHAAHITGISSEDATLFQSLGGGRLSLQGLVIAGMLIGALGVLNDVTVSQASTVLALRAANPAQTVAQLYRAGMGVGVDHLGATVNTLVFAYAGAALPILLIFTSQGVSFSDAVGRETIATEIVATLVGSIGLIGAVPLTTIVAALLAVRVPAESLPASEHVHAH
jgi:uncharacterized membrane protein